MRIDGGMRDWPVQTRLFAVILLALVMGLVFGGLRVSDAVSRTEMLGQTSQLARLAEQDVILTHDLENERDQTAGFLAGASPAALHSQIAVTNAQAARVRLLAAAIGAGFPANLRSEAATVHADATTYLPATRTNAQAMGPPTGALTTYAGSIGDITLLDSQIAQGVSDSALTDEVQTLTALAEVQDDDSQQRALLDNTFTLGSFADGTQTALSTAIAEEQQEENTFGATATRAEGQALNNVFATPQANTVATIENLVTTSGAPFGYLKVVGITSDPAGHWNRLISAQLDGLQSVELGIARDIVTRTGELQSAAQTSAVVSGAVSLAVLLFVVGAAWAVARSLVRPLHRLQAGALEIATAGLPERVRRLGEAGDDSEGLDIVPIDVTSRDEIGQVARAFDQVHREAVRLAGNEAMLRGSFNATFLSLSRRSQLLIERLARQIDSLEQSEENPELLAELFSMDHLVTRMRRNSENLLLLAGHEGSRRWRDPAPLADVARAAASEIEQYSRVEVRIGPGAWMAGRAVSDIVRLLAELIENATIFSPAESRVRVSARPLGTGGIVVEVTDVGVGISASRLADLNDRLENPPAMDASVARHMGLFAVARLAGRQGVKVRLRAGSPRGTTALVWLPDSILEQPDVNSSSGTWPGVSSSGTWPGVSFSGSWPGVHAADPAATGPDSATGPRPAAADRAAQVPFFTPAVTPAYSPAFSPAPVPADVLADAPERPRPPSSAPAASSAIASVPAPAPEPGAVPSDSPGSGSRWFRNAEGASGASAGGAVQSSRLASRPASGLAQSARLARAGGIPAQLPPTGVTKALPTQETEAGLPLRVPRTAGLPLRVPQASGISAVSGPGDGTAAGSGDGNGLGAAAGQASRQSPEQARSRLSGFQRGARRAKDSTPGAGEGASR